MSALQDTAYIMFLNVYTQNSTLKIHLEGSAVAQKVNSLPVEEVSHVDAGLSFGRSTSRAATC